MTEKEKLKAIHDYVVNNTVYDYQSFLKGNIPEDSFSPYGVLLKGTGVCSFADLIITLKILI